MAGNAREPGRSTSSRLLAVLGAFSPSAPALTLAQIASRTGLAKTTVHRITTELLAWGALTHGPAGFRVGIRIWELGLLVDEQQGLRATALPYLEDLHRASGENVQLAVLDDDAALLVEHLHGSGSVGTRSRVGRRLPLHATAVGKVLLAFSEEARCRVLAGPLARYTPRTVVDPKALERYLRRVRSTGIAYVFEEFSDGAVSVGAPVVDASGELRGAISLVVRTGAASPYPLASVLRAATLGVARRLPTVVR